MTSPGAAWLLEIWPRDDDGNEVHRTYSTHGLVTLPTDTVPTKSFRGFLAEAPNYRLDVYREGLLGGSVRASYGIMRLHNPHAPGELGPLEELRGLHFTGARWSARWASANPEPPRSYDEYEEVLRGRIERRVIAGGQVLLHLKDRRQLLEQDLNVPRFWGLGPSQLLMENSGGSPQVTCGDVLDQTGSFTWICHLIPNENATFRFVVSKHLASTEGYFLATIPSAKFRWRCEDIGPNPQLDSSADAFEVGIPIIVAGTLNTSSKQLKLYTVNRFGEGAEVGSLTYTTGGPAANAQPLKFATGNADLVVSMFSLWDKALSLSEVIEYSGRPLEGTEDNLVEGWGLNDGFGTTAASLSGSNDGTITNGTWEGAPLFGGPDLERVRQPSTWGKGSRNLEPVLVSAPDRMYMWHFRRADAVAPVRHRGTLLAEGAKGGGSVNYSVNISAAGSYFEVHTLPAGTEGRITCDAEGDTDGTKQPSTFAEVVEAMLTKPLGPLETGEIDRTSFDGFANLTELELYLRAGGKLSAVLAELAAGVGAAIDFDNLGNAILFRLERPVEDEAWTASTQFKVGNYRVPTDTSLNKLRYQVTTAGTTGGSEPSWPTTVGATVNDGTAVWTCRPAYVVLREDEDLAEARVLDELAPSRSQRVTWGRNYTVQRDGDLAADSSMGSTAEEGAAHRAFVARPYRLAEWPASQQLLQRHPDAEPGPVVLAPYRQRLSARVEARRRQEDLYGLEGLQRVRLTLSRPVEGLRVGSLTRVYSAELGHPDVGRLYLITALDFRTGKFGAVEGLGPSELPA